MERQSGDYATMGLNALKRATRKALESARRNNLQVPIWKDGKIEYVTPEIDTEQLGALDRQSAALLVGK
ncbi:MAG: hypothetical protein OCU20_10125 [Methanophagales archaeon]|nr:hypothetical protein [Methanophagales archaeon]